MNKYVLQDWVGNLTFMQQSVLITATRGPDGLRKDHPAKMVIRWLRRCYLRSALDGGIVIADPRDPRGGNFTGPSLEQCLANAGEFWEGPMTTLLTKYIKAADELPHHFQTHVMHAAEILGMEHPVGRIRVWWYTAYEAIVDDLHLIPEHPEKMRKRLGDLKETWLSGGR